MQAVNGYFLYLLGNLCQLFSMADNVVVSTYQPVFLNSLALLDNFKSNQQNIRNLPDSVKRADGLWNLVGATLEASRVNPASIVTIQLRMGIAHMLNSFQTTLEQELGKAYTFILEEKRGYSPSVLVDDIAKIISPAAMPFLSEFTLINLQEAGAALAFDHFTSSGFHSARAVEDSARRYFELVTGDPASGFRPKTGVRWYIALGEIAFKLNGHLTKLKFAKVETGKLGLVTPILSALCDIYRNPLSHPEIVALEEDDAVDVFQKGIDVISTMVRDVKAGGSHFSHLWHAYKFSWVAA